jgi:hypothetical protein
MKPDACARGFTVSSAWAKGTCSICAVQKEFQSGLADQVQIAADVSLCNFHTWTRNSRHGRARPFRAKARTGSVSGAGGAGNHAGGGILGRAVEFLVGQRGL